MSEFCPENVNRSDAAGVSSENKPVWKRCPKCYQGKIFPDTHYCAVCNKRVHYDQISPPASVAPQEEWTTKETFAGWSLYEADGELIVANLSKSSAEYIADLHNSRLREKE